ncbi:hypothetical protein I79_009677 [Cricetulus griseus]|uniref:Uncharacterized protein n=1 Tax=Cricetulus griseus TaxID=10029 RepID=G3HGF2_CRIGR|nr:hypothetical protein I79_009677 [Cricetulus griseus]
MSCLHLHRSTPWLPGALLRGPPQWDSSGDWVPKAPGGGGANGTRPSQWPTGKPRQPKAQTHL